MHAAEVHSYAVSIWVSPQGLSAPSGHSCLPFSSLPGDVGTLVTPPDLKHVTSKDPPPLPFQLYSQYRVTDLIIKLSETRFKDNMNHIGGMKRERDDDEEVNRQTFCCISQHSSISFLSPPRVVTPARKKEGFNLEVMVPEQARRRRAG